MTFEEHYEEFRLYQSNMISKRFLPLELFSRFYGEEARKYHNKDHIVDLLSMHAETKEYFDTTDTLCIYNTIWFHDIIYDPSRNDNEWTSAEFYKLYDKTTRVVDTILSTQHLKKPVVDYSWSLYVLDLDLAGLGSERAQFNENSNKIYQECLAFRLGITINDFMRNRLLFWEKLLARGYIHHNPYNLDQFKLLDQKARENIDYEINHFKLLLAE